MRSWTTELTKELMQAEAWNCDNEITRHCLPNKEFAIAVYFFSTSEVDLSGACSLWFRSQLWCFLCISSCTSCRSSAETASSRLFFFFAAAPTSLHFPPSRCLWPQEETFWVFVWNEACGAAAELFWRCGKRRTRCLQCDRFALLTEQVDTRRRCHRNTRSSSNLLSHKQIALHLLRNGLITSSVWRSWASLMFSKTSWLRLHGIPSRLPQDAPVTWLPFDADGLLTWRVSVGSTWTHGRTQIHFLQRTRCV